MFFCYVFWKWLQHHKLDTSSFQIVQYDIAPTHNTTINLEFIKSLGKDKQRVAASAHFTWMYEGKEYDAEGIANNWVNRGYKRTVLAGLNTETGTPLVARFCINALLNGHWNSCFNRKAAIHDVQDALRMKLPTIIYQAPPKSFTVNEVTFNEINWGWW